MTKYIDADIFVTHCCNSCIKNGVSCCPTVDSCDYIEDLQAFLVDAPAAADRLEQQEQRITELERELAAAKEDITSIAKQSVEDFEKRAWTPPCRFCVKFEECDFIPTDGGCCFEWRGAREGEGK